MKTLFSFIHFDIKKAMRTIILLGAFILTVSCSVFSPLVEQELKPPVRGEITFDGEQAYQYVIIQVDMGPRVPGSEAHRMTGDWIASEMTQAGWEVEFQPFEYGGYSLRNIIARSVVGAADQAPILIGAHYDTRLFADQDSKRPDQPVPGANDGASGVAVLLELARVLNTNALQAPIWFAFFDAEDNGRIQGWDWILGSMYFVDQLNVQPSAVVIVDMVGDSDLQLYYEMNSDSLLQREIWQIAEELGYDQFIPEGKYHILDDHIPFLQAGIPAVDIIDFDYAYFHTTEDLPDKLSAESLQIVGHTLEVWLETSR
jgi:Zn-dependent M28 family amino/carboxypeptidase